MTSPATPRAASPIETLPSPAVASPSPLPSAAVAAPAFRITAENLRSWSAKSIYSLIDQGLTSLTGFFVSFLLARWLSAEIFGAYAIAFATYLFIAGFHNVTLLEPISVFGPSRHAAHLREYFRAQLILHIILCAALSAIAGLVATILWFQQPQSPLVGAIAGSALAIPFLLLLWLVRRMCYVLQRPRNAILGSASCLACVLAGLYVLRHLDWLDPFSTFLLIAAASLLGSIATYTALLPTTRASASQEPFTRISFLAALHENVSYARWLIPGTALYSICSQVQIFFAAAFLGLGSAGILRAMMLPAAVMTQAVSAADMLLLPSFSYDFGRGAVAHLRHKAVLVSIAISAAGFLFAAFLWLIAAPLEHTFFRGKFAPYAWLIPLLALVPAANGLSGGFSAALRSLQLPHTTLIANAIAAPVSVITAFLFIRWWGLAGAAISMVAGLAVYSVSNAWLFFVQPAAYPTARRA
jgi:O-antigen/teichoic acid export membrane protein